MAEVLYKPSGWQLEFHGLRVREALGAGAAGVGKTRALLMDPVITQVRVEHDRCLAMEAFSKTGRKSPLYGVQFDPRTDEELVRWYGSKRSGKPGWTFDEYAMPWGHSTGWALHLRRELKELAQTIALSMIWFATTDPGAKYDRESHTWRFSSGYRFQFGHCKDENDHVGYLGSAYTHIGFDELVTFIAKQYDEITLRLRSGDPVLRWLLRVRGCSNPGVSPGGDPAWVRKMFVDPAPEGRKILVRRIKMGDGTEREHTLMFLPGRLADNPDKTFAEQYEQQIRSRPRHLVRAYLDGDWDFVEGTFFGEDIDPRVHVVRPFKIPRHWPVIRSLDWGFKTAGCCLWGALDEDENLVVFEEFWFSLMTDKEVAERIKQIETGLGLWDAKENRSRVTGPADTQLWEERGDSAERKVDVFARMGVTWVQADKKSREDNAQRVLKRLKDNHGGTTMPGLVFTSNCPRLVRTMRLLLPDPLKPEEPKKGGDDHGYDACSYKVAYATLGRLGIASTMYDDDVLDDDGEHDDGNFGSYGYARRR